MHQLRRVATVQHGRYAADPGVYSGQQINQIGWRVFLWCVLIVGVILLGFKDQEPGQRSIYRVAAFQSFPEVIGNCGAVNRQARLDNLLPGAVTLIGVLNAVISQIAGGKQLGHVRHDFDQMLRAALVEHGPQEHPELVNLEQDGRAAVQRTQQART